MAGNGPAPKDKSERRRSNTPARGEWTEIGPLDQAVLPELPSCPFAGPDDEPMDWSDRTKAAWAAWRADPVTQMYSSADIGYALDTIVLYEAMTPSTANEIRLRMDGLGLTPKGKQDRRWRIVADAEATTTGRPKRKQAAASSNRRSRLSVVQ